MRDNPTVRRSWLFVPGDRPDRFEKARASDAHAVVCDLEDGVLPEHKLAARDHVRTWLDNQGAAYVRVNAAESEWFDDDLDALRGIEGLLGLLLPKCEAPETLDAVGKMLRDDQALIALVETALGLSRVMELASSPSVSCLGFGSFDYAADLNVAHTPTALLHARSTIVMASRVAGIAAPLDGVTPDVRDEEQCRADADWSRELGFAGKMCVHPAQVAVVNEAFNPTVAELAWARRVVEVASEARHGALSIDGQLIDGPVIERARRLLAEEPMEMS